MSKGIKYTGMEENMDKKIIGWRDYYDVKGTYGERQGRARYIIEKEFNDSDASCHSIKEGIQWIQNLIDEYKDCFDLAYVKGTVQHIQVPVIENEDGDEEEDWNGDIQYLESDELEWSDDDDDDDDDK